MHIRSGSKGAAERKIANSIFLQTEKYQSSLIFFRLYLVIFLCVADITGKKKVKVGIRPFTSCR